jgi:RNA polymerase sigma-70 factor (ECF subfamily)
MQDPGNIDRAIIQRHMQGDPLALGELDRRYRQRLHRYCARLLDGRTRAEDIVQIALTKAFLSIGTLERPESFYGWLFTIARNEACGVLRSRSDPHPDSLSADVYDTDTPFEILDRGNTADMVNSCLDRLSVPYREIIVLRHFEGLAYAEIAALTGESISAVESRLYKARRALAQHLKPLWDERRTE